MGEWFGELTARAMEATGQGNTEALAALFLIAALTEMGMPFPFVLDTVLFLVGYQFGQSWLQAIGIVLALMMGREAGSALVYWLFRSTGDRIRSWMSRHSTPLLRRFDRLTAPQGRQAYLAIVLARLTTQAAAAAPVAAFGTRASYAVAVARVTPGLLTAVSVVSGIIRLPYRYFALGIGLAALFADAAIISLGAIMHVGLVRFGVTPAPWLIGVGAIVNVTLVWFLATLLWRHHTARPVPVEMNSETQMDATDSLPNRTP